MATISRVITKSNSDGISIEMHDNGQCAIVLESGVAPSIVSEDSLVHTVIEYAMARGLIRKPRERGKEKRARKPRSDKGRSRARSAEGAPTEVESLPLPYDDAPNEPA